MTFISLALIQMRCEKAAIDENIKEMRRYLDQAKDAKADIVYFPEMNITGYIDPQQHPQAVISRDHPAIRQAADLSREYHTTIIAGFVEENAAGKPFITQLVAQDGAVLGYYRKKTIKDEEAEWFSPGNDQPVFSHSGMKYGIAICADIDDENIFRELAHKGARLVIACAAPGLYGEQKARNWQEGYDWWRGECFGKLGKYAADQDLHIAVATQAGRTVDEDFPGGGYLFSPEGKCLAQSSDWKEGMLVVKMPLE
ncbi:MAG: carbon-nitrogen hydrolase family protein [Candidatus Edwardsbacteria bacterium]|nr:carbon-nitrogen hydrolase family protein [Candidatus Edwardsbacteria bacterium]MBU1576800.1 carbon-nitrogen hydrolase family protein [Candidatus Edwardsbacteria bacterium]MBU2463891.1 carbon-nitrogen hydrolase family protein [Candidatus Edwardsbacteria bacterium]MBU2593343.1 carbon-nitrogen hydrolase family protein [Candidatus Edwardsbacteria bacterium]